MQKILWIVVGCVILFGCGKKYDKPHEGFIDVPGGKVWYKIVGTGKKTPLLLLHGGPGFTSAHLKPLEALGDERPVIFYDQLGSGKSERPDDTTLWKASRFVEELAKLRKDLDLSSVHILGHSWGTMLLTEYLTQKPEGIKSLIIASPCITVEKWLADANMLRTQLPQEVQDTLLANEKRGTVTSESYIKTSEEFYKRHVCRIPYTPEIQETFDGANMQVYNTMWGNNEFTSTGNLKTFDRSGVLSSITVPTLFTCGEFDEATPSTTKWYADQVKGAELVVIKDASHLTMNEKPEEYVRSVREFLKRVEAGE